MDIFRAESRIVFASGDFTKQTYFVQFDFEN